MYIKSAKLVFRLSFASSLKEKRQIARSMMDRAKSKFNASISEVDFHDFCSQLGVGVSVVSGQAQHGQECLEEIIRFMDDFIDNNSYGELVEVIEY